MNKSVVVLAIPHQLQGPGFQGYVDDPSYSDLVERFIRQGLDFVFEEAAGRTPSIAKALTESHLGGDCYMDVDPSPTERETLGIAVAGGGDWIDPGYSADFYEWAIVEENRKREELWRQKVEAQHFEKALMICGLGHCLSFAFRLSSAGINVEKSYSYIPHAKLAKFSPRL